MRQLPIWTPLASIVMAGAWLVPNAAPPWVSFHKEAWISLLLLVVALAFHFRFSTNAKRYWLEPVSAVLLLLAALTCMQWLVGTIPFVGHALLGVSYLLAAAIAIIIGQAWEQVKPGQLGDFLFASLLVGALGTLGIVLAQWQGQAEGSTWISGVALGGRPYGNLMQPNNTATLLLLGMVALYWFIVRQQLRGWIACVAAVALLFAIALTGSKAGYLSFALCTLALVVGGGFKDELRRFRILSLLLLVFLPLFIALISVEWGGAAASGMVGPQLDSRPLASTRVQVYAAYADAVLAHPWMGYGFGQGARAQIQAVALGHSLPGLFTWSHNAFLDVASWFGVWASALLIYAVLLSLWAVLHSCFSATRLAYLLGVAVVGVHSMVELPHGYAYFLLPASLLFGGAIAGVCVPRWSLPNPLVGVGLIGLALVLSMMIRDYFRIESAFYGWRFKEANFKAAVNTTVPDVWVLDQFHALLIGLIKNPESLRTAEVARFEQAVMVFPSAAAMQRLAQVQLLRDDVNGAKRANKMAQILANSSERAAMAARWQYLASRDTIYSKLAWQE